jgi:P-type conjugative transfer protein TrbJ
MRYVKQVLCVSIVFTLAMSESIHPAQAGGISGVATEWTQRLNNIQLTEENSTTLQQLENQFQQLQHELTMIQHAELQTQSMTNIQQNPIFGSAMQDMMQLSNIVQQGNALAYSMANLDQEFSNRYRGFGYTTSTNYPLQYKKWLQTSLDTSHGALDALNIQGSQLNNDTQLLTRLEQQSQSSTGLLQAIQTANQLAAQEIVELQKLRQLMMVDIQSKQVFQAQQLSDSMATSDMNQMFFSLPPSSNSDSRTFAPVASDY